MRRVVIPRLSKAPAPNRAATRRICNEQSVDCKDGHFQPNTAFDFARRRCHPQLMPIVVPNRPDPLADGRQSEKALLVRRGVQRLFFELGASVLPELTLASGRRADIVALMPDGAIAIVEIKSSIEDLRVDAKWPDYRMHCDRLYFATHCGVPASLFPHDCGFVLSDGYGAEILREAPEHKLPGATRRAMLMRFARVGADRLLRAEMLGAVIPVNDS